MKPSTAYFENPEVEILFNAHELRGIFSMEKSDEPGEEEYDDYELLESAIRPISYSEFLGTISED